MAEAINEVLVQDMRKIMNDAPFVALALDTSEAVGHVDYMDIEARAFYGGQLHMFFICLEEVGVDPSAAGYFNTVMRGLEKVLGWGETELEEKLVATATDGASVMQGSKSGLVKRLRDIAPYNIGVQCTAHQVNLAADVLDDIPAFHRIKCVVQNIRNYFSASPKRTAALKLAQKDLDCPELLPIKVQEVRWMTIQPALERLVKIMPALLNKLKEDEAKEPDVSLNVFNFI
jgi:hypothetical protein